MARLLAFASAAVLALSVLPVQAQPYPVTPAMKAMIGKRFWVADPATPVGIEFCPSPLGRFKECRRLSNATFTVEGAVPSRSFPFFRVKLDSGEIGFISQISQSRFHIADEMDDGARARIAQCERQGPAIGATATNVRECWGIPVGINTTKTADGTEEQWVYMAPPAYIYLRGGVVTAIQLSR